MNFVDGVCPVAVKITAFSQKDHRSKSHTVVFESLGLLKSSYASGVTLNRRFILEPSNVADLKSSKEEAKAGPLPMSRQSLPVRSTSRSWSRARARARGRGRGSTSSTQGHEDLEFSLKSLMLPLVR